MLGALYSQDPGMPDGIPASVPIERAPGGERRRGVPSLLAQGVPGLVDAVPVTSPPVAAGGGLTSGGGSPQQAERTRVEETLRVSAGGNAGTAIPSLPCQPALGHTSRDVAGWLSPSTTLCPFLQAPAPKVKRGRRVSVA